jgi:plasmid stability protein
MAMIYLKDFPDDLHHRMKVQAALERTTMKDLIIRLLKEYLEKQADQRKGDKP